MVRAEGCLIASLQRHTINRVTSLAPPLVVVHVLQPLKGVMQRAGRQQ